MENVNVGLKKNITVWIMRNTCIAVFLVLALIYIISENNKQVVEQRIIERFQTTDDGVDARPPPLAAQPDSPMLAATDIHELNAPAQGKLGSPPDIHPRIKAIVDDLNVVDGLKDDWITDMNTKLPDWDPKPRSCGTIEIGATRGGSKGGFFPNAKNCNINEQLSVVNLHPNVKQTVECQVSPNRSFVCDNMKMGDECTFPPFLYSGKYQCTSAKQNTLGQKAFVSNVVVAGDDGTEYDNNRIKAAPPGSKSMENNEARSRDDSQGSSLYA